LVLGLDGDLNLNLISRHPRPGRPTIADHVAAALATHSHNAATA